MAEYPLLIFPEPTRAQRNRRFGGGGRIRKPEHDDQANRIAPQFERLQSAMANLQVNPIGIEPEKVLVLETYGSIDNFVSAVRRIPGLEWLAEFEQIDMSPEHGFARSEKTEQASHQLTLDIGGEFGPPNEIASEKPLRGQLFLVMSDQRALQELLSLFERWEGDPQTEFPYGQTKFRYAFAHLREIRPWGAEDRLRETGLLEDWQDRVEFAGDEPVPFEVELWFRDNEQRRELAEKQLRSVVHSLGGEIIQQCLMPEIRYHALLGSIPRISVQPMLDESQSKEDVELFRCEDIMFLRPVGQCAVRLPDDLTDAEEVVEAVPADKPTGAPIVALLDGLPLTNTH